MKLGLELAFIPDYVGTKEYPTFAIARRAALKLNRLLTPINRELRKAEWPTFRAKRECFRWEVGEWRGFIVEVNPSKPIDSSMLADKRYLSLLQRVYDAAKSMRLVPRVRRRGVHHPSGGGHIHAGIQHLFLDDCNYLSYLSIFEKSICTDYANRPYIRWLFSEWFDEALNSRVAVDESDFGNADLNENVAHHWTLYSGIVRRFSNASKSSYSTYEHRYFDAAPNLKQLLLQVRFLEAWVNHHASLAKENKPVLFTLTKNQFKSLRNLRLAWATISRFLRGLGLRPADYRPFFEDQYVNRIRYGSMT